MAVILDGRAAAGAGDHDRVQSRAIHLRDPSVDVAAGRGQRRLLMTHVMAERSAASLAFGQHDLDPEPCHQFDSRFVDAGIHHRLDATGQKARPASASRLQL